VIHGSRDPRPQRFLWQLLQHLRQQLPSTALVAGGSLECAGLPLSQQLVEFGQRTAAIGIEHLRVVPLFLLPGVHVKQDLPEAVAIARAHLPTHLTLEITPHLGAHPGLATLIQQQWQALAPLQRRFDLKLWPLARSPETARVLLAHGSRRLEGQQAIAALATQLQAQPAYWAVPPDLKTVIESLIEQQPAVRQISIFPYFLFAGKVLDAIMQTVGQLNQDCKHPSSRPLEIRLVSPLQVTDDLTSLVCDLAMGDPPVREALLLAAPH
jgi:sirohydrochlorin cobaltochelatase